jgi:hypothetical protein
MRQAMGVNYLKQYQRAQDMDNDCSTDSGEAARDMRHA